MATQGGSESGGCARLPVAREPGSGTGICARGVSAGWSVIDSACYGEARAGSWNERTDSAALSVPDSVSGERGGDPHSAGISH